MGHPLPGFDTEIQKKPSTVGGFDEPIIKPSPVVPEKQFVDVPDIDPASGAAIGTSTRTEVAQPKQFEKYPTIAEFSPGDAKLPFASGAKLSMGIPFSSNPQQLVNMLKENVPGVKFTTDKYGNPMAVIDNQYYHLDRPDFNSLDFSRGVSKIGAALPLAAGAEFIAPLEAGAALATAAQTGAGALSNIGEQTVTKIAGSKEPYNLPEAATSGVLSGAVPLVGKAGLSFVQLMAPEVFAKLPTGAQNFFKKYADKLRLGEIPDAKAAEDMMLDDPRMASIAREIMLQDSPASDIIERAIAEREAGRQARIKTDVKSNLGRQTTTEQEMDQSLKAFKNVLSDELGPTLKNAPEIDPSSVVARIDDALKTAKGETRNALLNARKMLVLDNGSPATASVRNPVMGPEGQFKGRYEFTPGQEAKPPVYETSAQGLENARVALDRMVNFGDTTLGVAPKSLAKDSAILGIRRDLSGLLKKNVDNYEKIMGKYSNVYDLIDANEAGTNIFRTGKDQLRPDQVKALLNDPETAPAFKNGVRAAWENKLRNSPNDIAALRKGMGGEGDYIRENMELIYGKDAVENLLSAAERESAYQKTAADLAKARDIGMGKIGPETTKALEEPIISGNLADIPGQIISYPINRPAKFFRGQSGPKFEKGRADFLTAKGPQIGEYKSGFDRAMERAAAAKPFLNIAPAVAPQAPDYIRSLNEASGGRIGHASGGKVGVMTAESLLKDLNRRKVMMANKTEQMLSLPDDAIVQALDAAKR
jgi:hypothetical protein